MEALQSANPPAEPLDEQRVQRELTELNRARLTPTLDDVRPLDPKRELALRQLEEAFIERERSLIRERAAEAPSSAAAFVAWFEGLKDSGPGQHDPLFPWLAEVASLEDVRWYLSQEVAGEAGFDDLLALTQVKFPVRPKLEMGRNFWDEMGRGHAAGMHGPLLGTLAAALGVTRPIPPVITASVALSNLMVALAANRRFAFQSIGALGAIELTAPGRSHHVDRALRRLRVAADERRYFTLHATLDVQHSKAWNAEVLAPLVEEEPRAARAIAEGALLRLTAGQRCFEHYRRHLMVEH